MKPIIENFLQELTTQCLINETDEFEFYVEMLGLNWFTWGIVQNGKNLSFTLSSMESEYLDTLEKGGFIVLINELDSTNGSFIERKLYRITNRNLLSTK